MARPPLALNLGFVFPLQLFVMQTLGLLGRMFLIQLPALPDDGQPGGDFVVVQRLRRRAQAVGQALRGIRFV